MSASFLAEVPEGGSNSSSSGHRGRKRPLEPSQPEPPKGLKQMMEERRNEAAARSATAALATAALASPTSASESSFKHLASPSSSKRNIAGDDGSFSSGDGSRNNSLKRRAVQFAAEELSGSPAAGPRVPPAPVAVVVADDLWSSDDEEAAAAGDHAVLSAAAPELAAPDFVPVAVDGFEQRRRLTGRARA